jgi:hypothetical protein
MISALDSALQGIASSIDRLDRAADRVSRQGADSDLPRNYLDMIQAKRGVRANAVTVKVADEMTGSLIDILA